MVVIPADPGTPDSRSARRYLWWLVVVQRRRIVAGALLGSAWMIGLTLPPYLLSRAIDGGLRAGSPGTLLRWTAALLAVGVLNAWLGIMRHRTMTKVRMDAAFRTVQAVVRHSTRLGAALPLRVTAGEVATIGGSDVARISETLTVTGPGVGAVVAYFVVAGLLFSVSPLLMAVLLLGVPLLAVVIGPLLGRLQGAESAYRQSQGELTALLTDLVGGLRVLGGLGGKGLYADRYRAGSQRLRAEGYRVGAVTSWIQALAVGLPALFLAAVTWLAARMAAEGTITVGQLVAVYGYVAVLVAPVTFLIEGGYGISRGLVAARRVVRFLTLEPHAGPAEHHCPAAAPEQPSVLRDPTSGTEAAPGLLTALVSARPAETAAVVDRLGRFTASDVTWGPVRLDAVSAAQVRARILVADNEAYLFAGTLREALVGRQDRDDDAIAGALHTAVAEDVVAGLPDGLGSAVDAMGRNLSGGQRQRIRLAGALLADPEVLLAVDPTSAVDAHTEAAVAARVKEARTGRTTLVTTTSPLFLERADTVYYLVDGVAAAAGSHVELMRDQPGYRALVARSTGEETAAGDGTAAGDLPGSRAAPDSGAAGRAAAGGAGAGGPGVESTAADGTAADRAGVESTAAGADGGAAGTPTSKEAVR
ncbi:ABC transporter ATP-binding protein [Streptomyces sp. NBC_01306]|uniref:ABC transporter transmembrane domain-containing protein n=1 Tax=Streptomyces sp. NBC_01306 TaxID=2903819 RepID=UPI002251049D|nr:ABC transporter ATP-binding protein [Streptomyces sp. NBC_01306]MCX4728188.1 ABC transporter ATP-binding protein/permease [Streptomyces sp. NBC_01306]